MIIVLWPALPVYHIRALKNNTECKNTEIRLQGRIDVRAQIPNRART